MQCAGKMLLIAGLLMAGVGVLLMFSDRIPFLGKLPGDIHLRRDNLEVWIPVTTSVVVSLLISLVLWIIVQLRGK